MTPEEEAHLRKLPKLIAAERDVQKLLSLQPSLNVF
jgi:hypothetical protein